MYLATASPVAQVLEPECQNTGLVDYSTVTFGVQAAWRKDGASTSFLPFPQEPLNAAHLFLLSCSLLPTPNSTWVPKPVLALSTEDRVHFLSVPTQSTMISVLVERANFPGMPTGPHSSVVYTLFPGKGPAECELPEGEGTARRAPAILASATSHTQ